MLEGDIAEPQLRAVDATIWLGWRAIAASILHSAASLTFQAEEADGEPWRSNVEGTRHVLDVCRQAGIRQCHHVSTAYVCGTRRGRILETELDVGQQPGNDYERSKIDGRKRSPGGRLLRPGDGLSAVDHRRRFANRLHDFVPRLLYAAAGGPLAAANRPLGNDFQRRLAGRDRAGWPRTQEPGAGRVGFGGDDRPGDARGVPRPDLSSDQSQAGHGRGDAGGDREILAELVYTGKVDGGKANGHGQADRRPSDDFLASFREQMKVYQSYWSDDPQFDSTATAACAARFALSGNHARGDEPAGSLRDRREFWLAARSVDRAAIMRSVASKWLSRWLRLPATADAQSWKCRHGELGPCGAEAMSVCKSPVGAAASGTWFSIEDGWWPRGVGLRGDGAGPTCYLTSATFARLAHGDLSWEDSINSGRLVVAGNSVHPWELARAFRTAGIATRVTTSTIL